MNRTSNQLSFTSPQGPPPPWVGMARATMGRGRAGSNHVLPRRTRLASSLLPQPSATLGPGGAVPSFFRKAHLRGAQPKPSSPPVASRTPHSHRKVDQASPWEPKHLNTPPSMCGWDLTVADDHRGGRQRHEDRREGDVTMETEAGGGPRAQEHRGEARGPTPSPEPALPTPSLEPVGSSWISDCQSCGRIIARGFTSLGCGQ